jgi:type IV secretion system protein TrbL
MEPTVLTSLLKSFSFTFTSGGARIVPDALVLLGLIAIVELALIGLWWAWGTERDLTGLVVKIIAIGCVAVLIKQWHMLTHLLVDGFIQIGLKAGGDVISLSDFTDPGNIAAYGFSVTGALFTRLLDYTGWDAMKNLPEIILGAPVSLLIILAYFGLAVWIFVTLIDFYAHAAITTILLPFAINAKVAFVAEKAIAAIFASGVRLLVLSFITAATLPVLVAQQPGLNPTIRSMLGQLLGAFAVCVLAWRADKSAQGLLHGAPNLAIADVARFATTTFANIKNLGVLIQAARNSGPQPANPGRTGRRGP